MALSGPRSEKPHLMEPRHAREGIRPGITKGLGCPGTLSLSSPDVPCAKTPSQEFRLQDLDLGSHTGVLRYWRETAPAHGKNETHKTSGAGLT